MRLFFGLSLPDAIRSATAACAKEAAGQIPGRYVPGENHHITLAFLGDVPQVRVEDARRVLARCAGMHPAPRLTLDGYAYFGRAENGILILRVKSDPPLEALHEALVGALHQADLPADEGPFSPHITLARHARIGGEMPACPPLSFTAEQAHVFLSERDGDNVLRYTPIHTVSFRDDSKIV